MDIGTASPQRSFPLAVILHRRSVPWVRAPADGVQEALFRPCPEEIDRDLLFLFTCQACRPRAAGDYRPAPA